MVADSEEEALTRDRGDQLLRKQRKQYAANGREVKVVHLEEKVELEGRTLAHELSTAEDYNVVCDNRDGARLEGRERRLSLHEAEILRLDARNGLKDLLEDGP